MAKRIEDFLSPSNRQDVPYELPAAAYLRATNHIAAEHDQHREQRKKRGMRPFRNAQEQERLAKDYHVIGTYRHHVTDMRGVQTVKRANAVSMKD